MTNAGTVSINSASIETDGDFTAVLSGISTDSAITIEVNVNDPNINVIQQKITFKLTGTIKKLAIITRVYD